MQGEGTVRDEEWLVVVARGAPVERATPEIVVQAVGTTQFTLVAVVVDDATNLGWGDRLYVGPGAWDQVDRVRRQLTYQTLSSAAQTMLRDTIAGIVRDNETLVCDCFNTTRLAGLDSHPLDLLAGLDSDCRDAIIREREQRRFADLADLSHRVECLTQPHTLIINRVLSELKAGDDTYQWLTG